MTERVAPVCWACGSREITADASAQWDVDLQAWILTGTHETYTCESCGTDMRHPVMTPIDLL